MEKYEYYPTPLCDNDYILTDWTVCYIHMIQSKISLHVQKETFFGIPLQIKRENEYTEVRQKTV